MLKSDCESENSSLRLELPKLPVNQTDTTADSSSDPHETSVADEVSLFAKLALPSVLIQIFVLLTSAETAMFVGRCLPFR